MCRNSSTRCERAVQDHGAGRFGRDVAVLAEGDADRGRRQGGRVVDAVAQEHRVGVLGLFAHDRELLLGALAGVHFRDADLVRQVAHLRLAVAGDEHHAVEVMLRAQMRNERHASSARLVAKAERRGVVAVDRTTHSRPPTCGGRRCTSPGCCGDEFLAAGDLDAPSGDDPAQSFARAFADLRARRAVATSLRFGGVEDGGRQRMLRVSLQAGDERSTSSLSKPGAATITSVRARLAVGQRAGLVEDHRAAGVDLLEHGRDP